MKSEKLVKTQICCWRDNRWPCVLEVMQKVSMENPVSCLILQLCVFLLHPFIRILTLLFFIIPDFNVRFMSKIAQALHHMPRAYQAISFLPHVVTLLTGWPAEKASKGKQKIFRGIRTARCSLSEEQRFEKTTQFILYRTKCSSVSANIQYS